MAQSDSLLVTFTAPTCFITGYSPTGLEQAQGHAVRTCGWADDGFWLHWRHMVALPGILSGSALTAVSWWFVDDESTSWLRPETAGPPGSGPSVVRCLLWSYWASGNTLTAVAPRDLHAGENPRGLICVLQTFLNNPHLHHLVSPQHRVLSVCLSLSLSSGLTFILSIFHFTVLSYGLRGRFGGGKRKSNWGN